MKKNRVWILALSLCLLSAPHLANAKPLKVCAKNFKKTIEDCNDENGTELGKCVAAEYQALYRCLNEKAEYKDEDRGKKQFKKAYGDFYKRVNKAVTVCDRYTDEEKDNCLDGTYKFSLRNLNKIVKKHLAGKKKKREKETDVDKEVGDCEGTLKKKAGKCGKKEGGKIEKCLKKQYDIFYRCVVKDVVFADAKNGEKKFEKTYKGLFGRVADAVTICRRYTSSKMEKCFKATHKAAVKDFKKELRSFTESN